MIKCRTLFAFNYISFNAVLYCLESPNSLNNSTIPSTRTHYLSNQRLRWWSKSGGVVILLTVTFLYKLSSALLVNWLAYGFLLSFPYPFLGVSATTAVWRVAYACWFQWNRTALHCFGSRWSVCLSRYEKYCTIRTSEQLSKITVTVTIG